MRFLNENWWNIVRTEVFTIFSLILGKQTTTPLNIQNGQLWRQDDEIKFKLEQSIKTIPFKEDLNTFIEQQDEINPAVTAFYAIASASNKRLFFGSNTSKFTGLNLKNIGFTEDLPSLTLRNGIRVGAGSSYSVYRNDNDNFIFSASSPDRIKAPQGVKFLFYIDNTIFNSLPGSGNSKLEFSIGENYVSANSYRVNNLNIAPSSATDSGIKGEIRYTNNYIYVCISANNWVRATLNTW